MIPNIHFHKDWQRYVRTWFDQPAKKVERRRARAARAAKLAPRPVDLLRPAVRCPTLKYNMRLRAGRGFSLDELKAAGVARKQALSIGIPVDHRRKNRSQEGFQNNVARLKAYKARLILFPLNPTAKRARKGDATTDERTKARQVSSVQDIIPISNAKTHPKARLLTAREKNPNRSVVEVMHKARIDKRLRGIREKKAKEKKEGKMEKKKKQKAEEEVGGDE